MKEQRRKARRLLAEQLEDRCVPSVALWGLTGLVAATSDDGGLSGSNLLDSGLADSLFQHGGHHLLRATGAPRSGDPGNGQAAAPTQVGMLLDNATPAATPATTMNGSNTSPQVGFAPLAPGNTYYVATTGSDSNNGSSANPWKTIQHASDSVHAGDTVIIEAGTYVGFDVQTTGTATAPITFEAAAGAKVVIDSPEHNRGDSGINIEDFNAGSSINYITIQGLDIDNSVGTGNILDGIRAVWNGAINSTGIQMIGNTINDCGVFGVLTGHEDNLLIQGNTVSNTKIYKGQGGTGHGIYVSNACFNPHVIGNTLFGNQSLGLHMNGDASEGPAIEPDGTDDGNAGNIVGGVIEDNIIYNNGVNGINCDGAQNCLYANNLLYGNGGGIVLYQIDAAAPAINNVVVDNTVIVAATDIMGNAGRWDIQVMDGTAGGSTGNTIFNNILINQNPNHGSIEVGTLSLSGFTSNYNVITTSGDNGGTSNNAFDLVDSSGNDNFVSFATWKSDTGQDAKSFTADSAQLFVNPSGGNYQLKSGSPAIGAGIGSLAGHSAPSTDLAGNPRPTANGFDIGCYEFVAPPPAPTGLTATPASGQITLQWNASSGATSYNIYRATTSGGETLLVSGVTGTSYLNTGLTNGTTYYYKVKAVNSAGTSGFSNEASATPQAATSPPPAPAGLAATAGNGKVTLSWNASTGATSYNVYRSTTSGGETLLASGDTSISYTDNAVTNGTTYYYEVKAVNSAGASGFSNEVSATPQVSAPPAPTGLAATAGNGQVTLGWNASSGATSYNLYRGTASGAETLLASGLTGTSFTDTSVVNGTTYYYIVRAVNAGGTSTASNEASATPQAPAHHRHQGLFFIDGVNQLWVFENGSFTNTGAFAKIFSAGIDAEGNAECWFLDGNNQLWRYDNGVFTDTGAFAQKIAAGQGLVAFTDGNNQLWTCSDNGGGFKNTGGFAARFTVGFDSNGNNQIVFADGMNQLWTYQGGKFTNTGAFTKLFVAGQDAAGNNEIWFTDGNNEIWRLDQGKSTAMGAFARQITGSSAGQVYFVDGINQIWGLSDAGVAHNTHGFAEVISSGPDSLSLFFTDGINQIWEYQNGTFTNTGGFALRFSAY
jgi:fibronectin type 3 domain-containing protein